MKLPDIKKMIDTKKKRRILAVMIFVLGLAVAAITGAFFTSQDVVTNHFKAALISIAIAEPMWDETGAEKAKKSLPGMEIEKDPKGVNDGEAEMYVRLKVTIKLTNKDKQDVSKILQAITYKNHPLWDTAAGEEMNHSNNPSFWGVKDNESENSYFFYYCNSNHKMINVTPDGETAVLFDEVVIPKLKPDYKGTFDMPYTIEITAEGLPVTLFDEVPDWKTFADNCGN